MGYVYLERMDKNMKKKSRIVSLLLVCVMLCGMLAMTVGAYDAIETTTKNGRTLMIMLSSMGGSNSKGHFICGIAESSCDCGAVSKLITSIEIVDYYTGVSYDSVTVTSNNASEELPFSTTVVYCEKASLYGCAEIRDSFNMIVYASAEGITGE